jgi:NAD(P)H dehydrogenase (quinone)
MKEKKISIISYTRFHTLERIAQEIFNGVMSVDGISAIAIPVANASDRIEEINGSDAIIFGSPTYFGSVASEMKIFFDTTTQIWLQKKWQNKIAAGFTHSSSLSGDKVMTLTQMMVFAMQHGMIWSGMDLLPGEVQKVEEKWKDLVPNSIEEVELNRLGGWMGLMCQSNPQKGVELPYNDLYTARYFGKRIANIAMKMQKI